VVADAINRLNNYVNEIIIVDKCHFVLYIMLINGTQLRFIRRRTNRVAYKLEQQYYNLASIPFTLFLHPSYAHFFMLVACCFGFCLIFLMLQLFLCTLSLVLSN
jgi:hypothetical protein